MDSVNTTVVKIFGREYPLRCDDNEARVHRIAELVDAKMRAIAKSTSLSSHSDIAVLAALNLAHELLGDRVDVGENSDEFSSRAESLLSKLEETLPDFEPAVTE